MRTASIILITLLAAGPRHGAAPTQTAPGADTLRAWAAPVRSIDPADEDFSDLEPLVERIGDARVVVLGEATHSHGTTSRAKARLVRFLHERMGFDVVAWETGLLQTYAMNTALRHPTLPLAQAASYLMAGGWASEEAIRPLFEYARASWQTGRPLEMAGFDTGRPHVTAPYFRRFVTALGARVPQLALSDDQWALVDGLTARGYGFISSEQPPGELRRRQRAVLETLLARLTTSRADLLRSFAARELDLAERFIADALFCEQLRHLRLTEGPAAWNAARDRYMADNLLWLMETMYPGRKVVVWAATAHFIRDSTAIRNLENPDWYRTSWEAGNHLFPRLGRDLYTIAFTSYAGRSGDVFPDGSSLESRVGDVPPAPDGSFEAAAHGLGQPYLFVDLRGAPAEHWLRGEYVSVALGRAVNRARWQAIVDAFFFIDQAEPNRHLPREP